MVRHLRLKVHLEDTTSDEGDEGLDEGYGFGGREEGLYMEEERSGGLAANRSRRQIQGAQGGGVYAEPLIDDGRRGVGGAAGGRGKGRGNGRGRGRGRAQSSNYYEPYLDPPSTSMMADGHYHGLPAPHLDPSYPPSQPMGPLGGYNSFLPQFHPPPPPPLQPDPNPVELWSQAPLPLMPQHGRGSNPNPNPNPNYSYPPTSLANTAPVPATAAAPSAAAHISHRGHQRTSRVEPADAEIDHIHRTWLDESENEADEEEQQQGEEEEIYAGDCLHEEQGQDGRRGADDVNRRERSLGLAGNENEDGDEAPGGDGDLLPTQEVGRVGEVAANGLFTWDKLYVQGGKLWGKPMRVGDESGRTKLYSDKMCNQQVTKSLDPIFLLLPNVPTLGSHFCTFLRCLNRATFARTSTSSSPAGEASVMVALSPTAGNVWGFTFLTWSMRGWLLGPAQCAWASAAAGAASER